MKGFEFGSLILVTLEPDEIEALTVESKRSAKASRHKAMRGFPGAAAACGGRPADGQSAGVHCMGFTAALVRAAS